MTSTALHPLSEPRNSADNPRVSLRRRLWQTVALLAAVWLLVIGRDIHDRWIDPSPKLSLGHDLIPSYAAGELVRQGHAPQMYDLNAVWAVELQMIQQANLNRGDRVGPWLNPPFFALVFAPLSALPYRQAAVIFLIFNCLAFSLTAWVLWRVIAGNDRSAIYESAPTTLGLSTFCLAFLLAVLPLPFWQVMGHQQNTFISLLLVTLTLTCWHRGRPFLAGLIAGLLFFKPQLAVVFAAILVIGTGWRALAGLTCTGIALLAITLIAMPGSLGAFLHRLPPIIHWLQVESPYAWGRQVTFHSFWRLLIQGHVMGETAAGVKAMWWLSSGAIGIALAVAAFRFVRTSRHDSIMRDRLIAAGIVAMPLLMPYYMDYDLLLLIVPAALLAREWIRRPDLIRPADHWLLATWVLLALESHFNPGLAGEFHLGRYLASWTHLPHVEQAHLNLAVPLIAAIAILHLARCMPACNARCNAAMRDPRFDAANAVDVMK